MSAMQFCVLPLPLSSSFNQSSHLWRTNYKKNFPGGGTRRFTGSPNP